MELHHNPYSSTVETAINIYFNHERNALGRQLLAEINS